MTFEFRIQDPSNSNTTYLLEEIIKLIQKEDLVRWRGIYSWTTGKTLSEVFIEDPDISRYVEEGVVELVIGIDTITTDYALIKLRELNDKFDHFSSKIFHNDISDLFHPKISHFEFANGEHTLLVGSGNFTLTGLQTNIEAYTIATGTADEITSISVWDEFVEYHKERIKDIDEQSIEKAKGNRIKIAKRKRLLEEELPADEQAAVDEVVPLEAEVEELDETPVSARLVDNSRVLVAQVPAAGGRWRQIHYNAAVIQQFFQAQANSHQRVFLKEVRIDGTFGPDEVRPVVYSSSNKNYKIEVSARPGIDYPAEGKPIIVLREMGVRNFFYSLVLPGDGPYNSLQAFLDVSVSLGKGLKRVITDSASLSNIWPNSALV